MEKSFLNFKINHPNWNCGEQGERFISRLCEFQEQQVAARREEQQQALIEMQLQHHSSQVLARSVRGMGTGSHAGGFAPIPEDTSTAVSNGVSGGVVSTDADNLNGSRAVDAGGAKNVSMQEPISLHGQAHGILGGSSSPTHSGEGLITSGAMSGSLHLLPHGLGGDAGVGAGPGASLGLSLAMSNTMLGQSSLHPTRTVESILQSALRESAQGASLRDVISRKGTYRCLSSSSMLDNHVDASFYWLDRFREQAPSGQRQHQHHHQQHQQQQQQQQHLHSFPPPPPPLPQQQPPCSHADSSAAVMQAPPGMPPGHEHEDFSGDVSV
jgi:hypothetical protein